MKFFVQIDDQRKIIALFVEGINKNIPENCIEITQEQSHTIHANGHNKLNEDGTSEFYDFSLKEEKYELIISKRNKLLANSDWTVLPDSPLTKTKKQQWKVYRQALRDLSQQPGFPDSVSFPQAPQK